MGKGARDFSGAMGPRFGWPFAFYMGAQGSLIIYILIIWYYSRTMNKLDQEFGVAEAEED